MTVGLNGFYYNMPMIKYTYIYTPLLAIIPEEIIDQYELQKIARYGIVYIQIQNGMSGLK